MKNLLLFTSLFLWIGHSNAIAQNAFKQGQYWYAQRANQYDSLQVDSAAITKAISYFKQSLRQETQKKDATAYLLKSYYYKGMYADTSDELRKQTFEQAVALGEEMLKEYPESVSIKFWYSANLGRWAILNGAWKAARNGIAKKLRRLCQDIIQDDPQFEGGGGFRILAQVHFYTPNIPLVLGWPSKERAMELIKEAMKTEPNHPANRLLYAEILVDFNDMEAAKSHLEYLKEMTPRADYFMEDKFVQQRAQRLLEDLELGVSVGKAS